MDDDMSGVIPPSKEPSGSEVRLAGQQRRMVARYDRAELEDLYLRTYDENISLKKHTRKQEDKIKRMATKLLRLVNDQKKANKTGHPLVQNISQDRLEDLQNQLRDAEKQNTQLKEKLSVQRVALATNKRPVSTNWNNVKSRLNTGQPQGSQSRKNSTGERITKGMRVVGPKKPGRAISPSLQRQVTAREFEADKKKRRSPSPGQSHRPSLSMAENRERDEFIHELEAELHSYKQEMERLTDENRQKDEEYQETFLQLKQKMTADQRSTVQENIDVIRLQRQIKEKSSKMSDLQENYMMLDENLRTVKQNHDAVLIEMERLTRHLKDEQNRVLLLHNQLKSGSTNERKLLEYHEQIVDIKRDNEILKDANEKLVSTAFDMEREREWKERELSYKTQIAQLEATLKADLGEKGQIIDRLTSQRVDNEKYEDEQKNLRLRYLEMKQKYDDMEEKLKFFSKGSGVDFTEVEEALVLIKQRKQRDTPPPDFLIKVDEEKQKDTKARILELQAEYSETIHELEKTRNLLVMQHKINKDYQLEVKATTDKMEDMRTEYDMKLDEYAHLLDIRAARIKKLESQLRDVAYGTRQYKIPPPTDDAFETSELEQSIKLERGQNLFEIHVNKVSLSQEGLKIINDDEPSLFCTWEFFEFEIQSTPVMRSARPQFDFTSQYVVKVDDFFLHYLQKESCTLELHQAFGQDYQTIAACQMDFRALFDKPNGRIHGTVTLTGVSEEGSGVGFGTLEYWVRLKVPMDQALRRYKERTKALGYITNNDTQNTRMLQALDDKATQRPSENVNELHITIIRCQAVQARRSNIQPSPYCIYQFFDFNDHDTSILPNTNHPEFNDYQSYPVPMTVDLDNYLKKMPLKIFVFDDQDPEDTAYMGMADIPLLPLIHDKPIRGTFQLIQSNGEVNGMIEVSLSWQYSYLPPTAGTRMFDQMAAAPNEPPERLPVTQENLVQRSTPTKPKVTSRFPHRSPKAASTPMVKDVDAKKVVPRPRSGSKPTTRQSLVNDAVSEVVSSALPSTSLSSVTGIQDQSIGEISGIQKLRPSPATSVNEEITEDIGEEITEDPMDDEMSMGELMSKVESSQMEPPSIVQPTDTVISHPTLEDGTGRNTPMPEESSPSTGVEDTMFGDTATGMSVDDDMTEELEDTTYGSGGGTLPNVTVESDSEGVVVETPDPDLKKNLTLKHGNSVTVVISHLTFERNAAILSNEDASLFFVEYRFLDLPAQELETPFALPKPKTPGEQLKFNFSRTFPVDLERNYTKRQLLASMLLPGDPTDGKIELTVVTEPPEGDETGDCFDVGTAAVSLKDILINKRDVTDEDIPVYAIDDYTTIIGQLNISVHCLATLMAIEQEIDLEGTIG